jgi:hypothetical protein
MSKFKDFGAGASADAEPISFKLFDEEFHCVKALQGKVMIDLVAKSQSDNPAEQGQTVVKFFDSVLEDESLGRFNSLLDDKNRVVSVETLGEIIAWLMEQYGNRPESQPED